MPRPCFSCPVCFQPPCAHRGARGWLQDVLHCRQPRSGRAIGVGVASMVRLHALEAVSNCCGLLVVPFRCCRGPFGAILRLTMSTFNEWFNVEIWPSPAYISWLWVLAEGSVGLNLRGDRARPR